MCGAFEASRVSAKPRKVCTFALPAVKFLTGARNLLVEKNRRSPYRTYICSHGYAEVWFQGVSLAGCPPIVPSGGGRPFRTCCGIGPVQERHGAGSWKVRSFINRGDRL